MSHSHSHAHDHSHPLATERLVLREFVRQDKDCIYELLNTEGWLRFIGDRQIRSLEDAEYFITDRLTPSYRKHGFGFYAMLSKAHNKVIGMCGLVKREGLEHVDLGFAMLPAYTKSGFAFEASRSCITFAKNNLKLKTLAAICNTDNDASIKLLTKLGFKYVKQITLPNETTSLHYYELNL
jgi:ribosomal-protein-alanine N-acetyltransferase